MILFLKHIDIEGPGTIGTFFEKHEIFCRTVEFPNGDTLPKSLDGVDAVIILGGPMNVYEEGRYPWLKEENAFIQRVLREEIPLLGICLGSQLIAKACGAKVTKALTKEIGWGTIHLNENGGRDFLFRNLPEDIKVFQWHEDTFAIPEKAKLLASSPACPHQAYCCGPNAYGLQFHVEVTDEHISNWVERYFKVSKAKEHPKGREMLKTYRDVKSEFDAQAEILFGSFLEVIRNTKRGAQC